MPRLPYASSITRFLPASKVILSLDAKKPYRRRFHGVAVAARRHASFPSDDIKYAMSRRPPACRLMYETSNALSETVVLIAASSKRELAFQRRQIVTVCRCGIGIALLPVGPTVPDCPLERLARLAANAVSLTARRRPTIGVITGIVERYSYGAVDVALNARRDNVKVAFVLATHR